MTLPPTQGAVDSAIRRLRAECDAPGPDQRRALLLHEIAELEERFGDESSAARDQLAAVNLAPRFREPLERLLSLVQQKRSHRNKGRLLERLVNVAETDPERVRALLDRAAHWSDNEDDLPAAREALEQAAALAPENVTIWLALEILAGQLNDPELRARALAERAARETHPTWKALLLVDHAELCVEAGETDRAIAALDAAIALRSEGTAPAIAAKAALGRDQERWLVQAEALSAEAALVNEALGAPEVGIRTGLPPHSVRREAAADLSVRAAEAFQRAEAPLEAAQVLARARELLPDDVGLLIAQQASALRQGDRGLVAQVARGLLQRGADGPAAATLWLWIAEAHADSEPDVALDALSQALQLDPDSSAARALELDLLSETGKLPRLARALAETAQRLENPAAKFRLSLAAADIFGRHCADPEAARTLLAAGTEGGVAPPALARLARMYAALTQDRGWFREATEQLALNDISAAEAASVWFELARLGARANDAVLLRRALEQLTRGAESAWLGYVLSAYALGGEARTATAALSKLAELESDADAAHALRVVAVARSLENTDDDAAHARLSELHLQSPHDPIVASALSHLTRERGNVAEAASVLEVCARAAPGELRNAALFLEAGILHWRAGARESAVQAFSAASEQGPEGAAALLRWALRATDPDNVEARLNALETDVEVDIGLGSLERVALCLARPKNPAFEVPTPTLETERDIFDACQLGAALVFAARNEPEGLKDALQALSLHVPKAAELAPAACFRAALAGTDFKGGDAAPLEQAARELARKDSSVAASLEWLAALHLLEQDGSSTWDGQEVRDLELQARLDLAGRLEALPGMELRAGAALAANLAADSELPLLSGEHGAIRLANLELAAPGGAAERRARALSALGPELGEESQTLAQVLAGYNFLASGEPGRAMDAFQRYVALHPKELIGWEGLRAAAVLAEEPALEAQACATLGELSHEDALGAEFWERAGLLFAEQGRSEDAEAAFGKALDRDIKRAVAFDKLFRSVRARKAPNELLRLIDRRLNVSEDPEEISKLYWEQARAFRGLGDANAALEALESVWMLEPDHVGALALAAEIFIGKGQFESAAEYLMRLARLPAAPQKQRLISAVAAVDLFENKLANLEAALGVLTNLESAGLATLPIRERLVRIATSCGEWEQATAALEKLSLERPSSEGRAEAARLALAIYRDEIADPRRAEVVTRRLLAETPDDAEALDLVLEEIFDDATTVNLLETGKSALLTALRSQPLDVERLELLARIAKYQGDSVLREATLGALVASGVEEAAADLDAGAGAFRATPEVRVPDALLTGLVDADERGAIHQLLLALAPTIADGLGPDLDVLGVSRKQRVVVRQGLGLRNEIAAWFGALGLGDFELYVGGNDPTALIVLGSELPKVVVGASVQSPLSPVKRARLAAELFALRRGTSVILRRPASEVAALIVAACAVGETPLSAPPYALQGEFERVLKAQTPRRVKKLLPELAQAVLQAQQEPASWIAAARRTLQRMSAAAVGDVSWVLSHNDERGTIGASVERQHEARHLFDFILGEDYARVRKALTARLP